MNSPSETISDELLYAYVDGEVDAVTAARVRAAMEQDPSLAARIARQQALRTRLQSRFPPVDEPVPARLQAALDPPARHWSWREWGAMAATLVLGALIGPQFVGGGGAGGDLPLTARQGQIIANGELDSALSQQLSQANAGSGAVAIGLSVRTTSGELCRSFQLEAGQAGLACRRGEDWVVDVLSTGAPVGDGYRQAASALPEPVRLAIEARAASEPLSPAEERAQRESGWRSDPAPED